MSCIIKINCLYPKNQHYQNKFNFNIIKDENEVEYIECTNLGPVIPRDVGEKIIECAKLVNSINLDLKKEKTPHFSVSLSKRAVRCSCSCNNKFRIYPNDLMNVNSNIKCIFCKNEMSHESYLKVLEVSEKLQKINISLKDVIPYSITVEMEYKPDNESICAHDFSQKKELDFHHLFLIEYS